MRSHTTARLEFDRDTYTPFTAEELPSLAMKDFMIAARSDLVAGLADELPASALAARVDASTTTASAAINDERTITPTIVTLTEWPSGGESEISEVSFAHLTAIAAGRLRVRLGRRRVQTAQRWQLSRVPARSAMSPLLPTARDLCRPEGGGDACAPCAARSAAAMSPAASGWWRSRVRGRGDARQ